MDALIALAECPAADGLAVNLGSTEEVAILELAEMVQDLAREEGLQPQGIGFVPYADVCGSGFKDASRRLPAPDRIEALTGWRPRIPLVETSRRVFSERLERRKTTDPTAPDRR